MEFRYDQVKLRVMRDPECPDRNKLAATITVAHEKREKQDPNAVYVNISPLVEVPSC